MSFFFIIKIEVFFLNVYVFMGLILELNCIIEKDDSFYRFMFFFN